MLCRFVTWVSRWIRRISERFFLILNNWPQSYHLIMPISSGMSAPAEVVSIAGAKMRQKKAYSQNTQEIADNNTIKSEKGDVIEIRGCQ